MMYAQAGDLSRLDVVFRINLEDNNSADFRRIRR